MSSRPDTEKADRPAGTARSAEIDMLSGRVRIDGSETTSPPPSPQRLRKRRRQVRAQIGGDDGPIVTATGRAAWALERLIAAGGRGITSVSDPAPRLADYVFKLRRLGIGIITDDEPHQGEFAGRHARYRLATPVRILDGERAA
jgi:hypothetical protein